MENLIFNGIQKGLDGQPLFLVYTVNTESLKCNGTTFFMPINSTEAEIMEYLEKMEMKFVGDRVP